MRQLDDSTRTMKKMKMLLLPLLFSSIMAFQMAESYPSKSSSITSHILVRRIRDDQGKATTSTSSKGGYSNEPYLEFKSELPEELVVEKNGRYMLECEVSGQPNPIIYWLKNGKLVQQSGDQQSQAESLLSLMVATSSPSHVHQIGLHRVKSRLYLDCLHPTDENSDSVVFTCVAATPYQQKRASTRVVFKHPDRDAIVDKELEMFANQNSIERFAKSASPLPSTAIDDFLMSTDNTKMCLKKKSLDSSPRIYFWTETIVEAIGNDGLIHCRSSGYPRPAIEWLINEQPLDLSDTRYNIQPSGDLFIKNVTFDDMGIYKCLARNDFGQDSIEKIFFYPILKE